MKELEHLRDEWEALLTDSQDYLKEVASCLDNGLLSEVYRICLSKNDTRSLQLTGKSLANVRDEDIQQRLGSICERERMFTKWLAIMSFSNYISPFLDKDTSLKFSPNSLRIAAVFFQRIDGFEISNWNFLSELAQGFTDL